MLRYLLILLFPLQLLAQFTYVPDDNFEQRLINLGYDFNLDDYVETSSIDTVTYLDIPNQGISDVTGLEAFVSLRYLFCQSNEISVLDLHNLSQLFEVNCASNQLVSVDVRNGNNSGLWYWNSMGNSSLNCIDVDDVFYADYAWATDSWTQFSNNCNPSSVNQFVAHKKLIKVLDVFGRNVTPKPNMTLFYVYDDGTIEKKIMIK